MITIETVKKEYENCIRDYVDKTWGLEMTYLLLSKRVCQCAHAIFGNFTTYFQKSSNGFTGVIHNILSKSLHDKSKKIFDRYVGLLTNHGEYTYMVDGEKIHSSEALSASMIKKINPLVGKDFQLNSWNTYQNL